MEIGTESKGKRNESFEEIRKILIGSRICFTCIYYTLSKQGENYTKTTTMKLNYACTLIMPFYH